MLSNYFKVALRNLLRYKRFALINVLGLAAGISCCIVILLYIRFELSYDTFHQNSDEIFRLVSERNIGESTGKIANAPFLAGPELSRTYPEIIESARLFRATNGASITYADNVFVEDQFFFADPSAFDVFTFQFLAGNPKAALTERHHLVISERMAKKYFGNGSPVGQTIMVKILDKTSEFEVVGVVEDLPSNSHFHFDFLVPFDSELNKWNMGEPKWDSDILGTWTYFLLSDKNLAPALQTKFTGFVTTHLPPSIQQSTSFSLQPLTDIHLHSHLIGELDANGNLVYVYVFSVVALLVLLIACVNFVNLSTAYASKRTREVGMRKVLGAHRNQLVRQFLGEAFLLSLIAMLLAMTIVSLTLPYFASVVGRPLVFSPVRDHVLSLTLAGIWLLTGLFSGIYPAFFLSSFTPIKVLKGSRKTIVDGRFSLRSAMIVSQFAISIVLLIAFWTIHDQMNYVKDKGLGFNQEQLVVITSREGVRFSSLQNELLKDPSILSATVTSRVPGGRHLSSSLFLPEGSSEETRASAQFLRVQKDFLETFKLSLIEGRDFSDGDQDAVILNKTAVESFGWDGSAIGKELVQFSRGTEKNSVVIGVIADVHFESLYSAVQPLVLTSGINDGSRIIVRVGPEDVAGALTHIRKSWTMQSPDVPLDFYFLDEDMNRMYLQEERMAKILQAFTFLAVFVTCIGLFGLVSFISEQRTKEIGIRKVLGASISSIVLMLSRQFVILSGIAIIVAIPVAYFAIDSWLEGFAYSVGISSWTFVAAIGVTLLLVLCTTAARTLSIALMNPVQTLQHE